MTRREFSLLLASSGIGCSGLTGRANSPAIATFRADVTPPIGHPLMGGGIAPAKEVATPLTLRGFVLFGAEAPVVFASIDWCEIRNESFAQFQSALAGAAGTTPERVMLTSVHVHDAPIMDRAAQRTLERGGAEGNICDLEFHDQAIETCAAAVRKALDGRERITHVGTGEARVERLASNRRFIRPNGDISFARSSSTKNPEAHAALEGTIDPFLKLITFWEGETAVASLSTYAIHPMSTYGGGVVSWDFVGDARAELEQQQPGPLHIYASGCSGNVTAGKHNDGAPERRPELAARLFAGMQRAWQNTKRVPVHSWSFRTAPLWLEARLDGAYAPEALRQRLQKPSRTFDQCLAALSVSWQDRVREGLPISLAALDVGPATILLLPAESYVEFQLYAQSLAPNRFLSVCGYGECGPGYIPIEQAWKEGDTNLGDWCWVAPGSEARYKNALRELLGQA